MGIFKKKEQPDDSILFKSDFVPSEFKEPTLKIDDQMFDEEIGFETGILKSNFTDIKHNSESLDVIRKKVVKVSDSSTEDSEDLDVSDEIPDLSADDDSQ